MDQKFTYSNFIGVFNLLEALRYLKNINTKLIHVSTDEFMEI